jgi:UDP-2-acetamido-2,6-beta-L-arabino-hexul-4-ose reductase
MKIGITGQSGFIGTHLTYYLKQKNLTVLSINKPAFDDLKLLSETLKQCDVVVHLAGMNRGDTQEIYETNVKLAKVLVNAFEDYQLAPTVFFASSTQEGLDNPYGQSKKDAYNIFMDWAERQNANFTSLVLPNIYGPFCRPFYNSVVATFCYQLSHNQEPVIQVDKSLKLLYINDLVEKIYSIIKEVPREHKLVIKPDDELYVTEILSLLKQFKNSYLKENTFPDLNKPFNLKLFNTFRSYLDPDYFPVKVVIKADARGNLVEAVKAQTGGQIFYSTTKPGVTRGNHYHRRKIERFFILKGTASIKLRRIGSDKIFEYRVDGASPSFVDIPILFTHNITNVGSEELITFFWANELFNPQDSDTYPEAVNQEVV